MAAAKIPTVSKFLCYFDLTTGGLVLGWFDAVLYGIVLAFLLLTMLFGFEIFNSGEVDNTSAFEITIVFVLELALVGAFFGTAVAFIKGIKDKSPKLCLPYVILSALGVVIAILKGLITFNLGILIAAGVKIYFFIIAYSIYKVFTYGDEQAAYEAHQNASSAGYEQYYQPEGNGQEGYNSIEGNETTKYQTTELQGP